MVDSGAIPDFENEVREAFGKQYVMGSKLDDLGAKFDNLASLIQQMLMNPPRRDVVNTAQVNANAEQDETSAIAADGDDRNATDPVAQNKKRAAAAQAEAGEFSMDEVYMTLVDPYVRDKVELNAYATAADDKYLKGIYIDVKDAFMDDFIFWTGEHFKLLPKELSRSIRDCLLGNGASIRKESGFPIWKALGEYTDGLRRGEMVDTRCVKCQPSTGIFFPTLRPRISSNKQRREDIRPPWPCPVVIPEGKSIFGSDD